MSGGLVLRLRPHEKFLVNGVVIENGDRRTRLRVRTQDAHILRTRDALHPEEANTPAKRLYYMAQLAVAGEADGEETSASLISGLTELQQALGAAADESLFKAMQAAQENKFYNVMRALNGVIKQEKTLLESKAATQPEKSVAEIC